jgi:sarcosine oxidase subunit beta
MSKRMIRLVPDLKDVSVVRHWSGHYTETPDGRPIIGPVKSMPSFINIAGFCGHGLMQGPRVGQLVAEQIVNGTASLDISSLALERFENPELLEKEQLH